ncbi:cholesterol 24-hydroxylase isoform X1 [Pantherophis guttatus]|uniref:Cholesterol 24-hydroxylase n=2 Tax=Pantherophis guttatus TaxID=94885 RepID=A0A6P9C3H2_PANGU|nr:cholesterol 24-hydroxylase isoform X1 [Pantherophis guttatus]
MEEMWSFWQLLLAVPLLMLGLYCCYIKVIHVKYDYIPGAPRASFFLGHLPTLWRTLKNKELIHDLFLKWAEKYGPVVRFNAFHRVALLILSPEGVKEYLMSPQYSKDPRIYNRLRNVFGVRFLGNGLETDLDYNHWHKQRKIMDPAFSRNYLIGLMEIFNDQAEDLMKVLNEKADGEMEVDMMSLLRRLTMDIIAKVAFGLELSSLHCDQTPFPHAFNMVIKGVSKQRNPFFQYLPRNRKEVQEVRESLRFLRHTGKECITQRRKAIQNEEPVPLDILTQILKSAAFFFSFLSVADQEESDDETMVDNFVTFFVAGHETTANQLSFTIMELARHPEIVTKLQAEVDEAIGVKRDVAYEDLRKLEYLSQVLKEILRLYPPVPGTMRWTEKKNVIEGIDIPANTTLFFSTYIMGRMDRYFKDALTFDPDRFSKGKSRPYFSYFPFSLGPRSCIGQLLAEMEVKVLMAKFLQRFEFELAPPQSFKILDTGSLRPLDGVTCRLKPRQQFNF